MNLYKGWNLVWLFKNIQNKRKKSERLVRSIEKWKCASDNKKLYFDELPFK